MRPSTRFTVLSLATALVVAACEQNAETTLGLKELPAPRASHGTPGQPDLEEFEICKYGPTATFDYTVDDLDPADADFSGSVTLSDGECANITESGGLGDFVTVTERAAAGIQLDAIAVTEIGTGTNATVSLATRTVTGTVLGSPGGGPGGVFAEFFNSRTGGEGCTPGYWKQPHHFDSWPAPYTPGTLFSDVFEDAYPGMTLLDVLHNRGNRTGLEALGRHTVAALLNSASVAYAFGTAEVINDFNAVFPGTKRDYNRQKETFANANEAVCPLN